MFSITSVVLRVRQCLRGLFVHPGTPTGSGREDELCPHPCSVLLARRRFWRLREQCRSRLGAGSLLTLTVIFQRVSLCSGAISFPFDMHTALSVRPCYRSAIGVLPV